MKNFFDVKYGVLVFALVSLLFACKKDTTEYPLSTEPINFITPDSTTIFADAGCSR